MKVASRCRIRVLIKVISFRVFSKISLGSSEGQRRQFGAQTMAKLFTSIFVITHIWGSEKICKQQRKLKVFQNKMFSTMQVLTVLRIRTPSLRTSKFELKKKNPTSENRDSMYAAALQSWSRSFVTLDHGAPDKLPYFPNKRRVQFFPHTLLGKWS